MIGAAGIPKDQEKFLVDLMRKITQTKAWAEYANSNAMSVKFLPGEEYGKYPGARARQLKKIVPLLTQK